MPFIIIIIIPCHRDDVRDREKANRPKRKSQRFFSHGYTLKSHYQRPIKFTLQMSVEIIKMQIGTKNHKEIFPQMDIEN